MTVLHFPSDLTVGVLDWDGSWSPDGGPVLARGDVRVPDGVAIRLEIEEVRGAEPDHAQGGVQGTRADGGGAPSGDSWVIDVSSDPVDLGFLRDLPPDAFEAVSIRTARETSFDALAHLAPGLRQLQLALSGLSDAVLPTVAALSGLAWLQTYGNRFTDDGIQQLVALTKLEQLYLEEETLTAAALTFAERLPRLVRLGVQDVDLDDAEFAALQERLPAVVVHR